MYRINGNVSRRAVLAGAFAAILSASLYAAQPPSTGLGQSWPNATDVSASPHYHAYVFVRDGIRYIQINDLGGTVLGAVATANHEVLVLPIGADAQRVSTSTQSLAASSANTGETVYSDGSMRITATPQSNGQVLLNVAVPQICTDPFNCVGGRVVHQMH